MADKADALMAAAGFVPVPVDQLPMTDFSGKGPVPAREEVRRVWIPARWRESL